MNTSLITRSAAVTLAALAFAAPVAGAEATDYQDLRSADAIAAEVLPQTSRGQNLRGADAQGAPIAAPDVMVVPITRSAPAAESDSIDWADTLIGAGGALGLTLVGLGGMALVVHRRRLHIPA